MKYTWFIDLKIQHCNNVKPQIDLLFMQYTVEYVYVIEKI